MSHMSYMSYITVSVISKKLLSYFELIQVFLQVLRTWGEVGLFKI